MNFFLIAVSILCCSSACAQVKSSVSRSNTGISAFAALGQSVFDVNVETENYATRELRFGASLDKSIGTKFGISSGLDVSLKFRRESYLVDGTNYYGRGVRISSLDRTVSETVHWSFNVPLTLRLQVNPVLSFNGGLMGRMWAPTDVPGDILRSQFELGGILSVSAMVWTDVSIGLDFYRSVIPVFSYDLRNRFVQARVAYRLKRK